MLIVIVIHRYLELQYAVRRNSATVGIPVTQYGRDEIQDFPFLGSLLQAYLEPGDQAGGIEADVAESRVIGRVEAGAVEQPAFVGNVETVGQFDGVSAFAVLEDFPVNPVVSR